MNEGLQKIGDSAFYKCESLEIISLPSTVTEIDCCAFGHCTHLREVMFNEGLQKIGYSAFYECESLEIISLPSTVTEVGDVAFGRCTHLREVMFNEGLQKIGDSAFYECESLEIISLPSTVTEVGDVAFGHCIHLREVIFNDVPQVIAADAFDRCESLECAKFPSVSKRINNLIESGQTLNGQTDIEWEITIYEYFEWGGDELFVSPEAINDENWVMARIDPRLILAARRITRRNLDRLLDWISHYELKESTTLFELALWKARIEEMGAVTDEERSACRGEVPGPAKDAILRYLQQTSDN